MELKTFTAQDLEGNVIESPSVTVYSAGTTTLATGLIDKSGLALGNPFFGSFSGEIAFSAPDGEYDIKVSKDGRESIVRRIRFTDLPNAISSAENSAASAAASAISAGRSAASIKKRFFITIPSGSMPLAVQAHAICTMDDGNVLVIGGFTSSGATSSVYRYNLKENSWTQLASIPAPLYNLTASKINGGVFVCGGGSNSAIKYTASTNSWSSLANTPASIDNAVSAPLENGKIFVAGTVGSSRYAYLYNPQTNSWAATSTPPSVTFSSACSIGANKVFVVGDAASYIYDGDSNSWIAAAAQSVNMWQKPTASYCGGVVLILGNTLSVASYTYDPATDTWGESTSMPYEAAGMASALISNDRVFVCGGATYSGSYIGHFLIYNKAA